MLLKIDGRELPFPQLDTLTFREAGLIKKATGLRMGQFEQALIDGDTDMVFSLALVAITRADGKDVSADTLLDMPIMSITLEIEPEDVVEDEEVTQDPPAEAAVAADPAE
jgi:hypothetical protein